MHELIHVLQLANVVPDVFLELFAASMIMLLQA
jgi:hypothetical protein